MPAQSGCSNSFESE